MSRSFNGSSDYLSTTAAPQISAFPMTLMAWVKPTTVAADQYVIGGSWSGSTSDYLTLHLRNDGLVTASARSTASGLSQAPLSTPSYTADAWQFVAAEFTGSGSTCTSTRAVLGTTRGTAQTPSIAVDFAQFNRTFVGARVYNGNNSFFSGHIAYAAWISAIPTEGEYTSLQTQAPHLVFGSDRVHYFTLTDNESPEQDDWGDRDLTVTGATYSTDNPDISSSALTKKLKVLVHPDAASASAVEGIVWQAGGIASTEIGEFTGKTFEATTEGSGDAERAVLLVPVADFGGGSLSVDDVVPCLVRNATYTTGIITGTVIEE
jgi:hypothetical protein